MDNDRSSAGYWVTAILVVLAVAAAAWWYTVVDTGSVLVPNTGASGTLDYTAE